MHIPGAKERYVTCGSVIKLLNTDHRVRLHSHDVKYGTGSGQQSVTGIEIKEDVGSHWVVKAANGKICPRGQPIKCGSLIRLEHLESKRNLHSHIFSSPLSSQQEISCYGENGEGDTGDHWKVICSGKLKERTGSEAWLKKRNNICIYILFYLLKDMKQKVYLKKYQILHKECWVHLKSKKSGKVCIFGENLST